MEEQRGGRALMSCGGAQPVAAQCDRAQEGQSPALAARAPPAPASRPGPVRVGSTKEQARLQSQTNERLQQCFSGHLMNNHAATALNSQPALSSAAEAAASTPLQHHGPGWKPRCTWVSVPRRVPPARRVPGCESRLPHCSAPQSPVPRCWSMQRHPPGQGRVSQNCQGSWWCRAMG